MNMIVCTCDHCGQVVENWVTLRIDIRDNHWQKEICTNCYPEVNTLCNDFIDSITVTPNESDK